MPRPGAWLWPAFAAGAVLMVVGAIAELNHSLWNLADSAGIWFVNIGLLVLIGTLFVEILQNRSRAGTSGPGTAPRAVRASVVPPPVRPAVTVVARTAVAAPPVRPRPVATARPARAVPLTRPMAPAAVAAPSPSPRPAAPVATPIDRPNPPVGPSPRPSWVAAAAGVSPAPLRDEPPTPSRAPEPVPRIAAPAPVMPPTHGPPPPTPRAAPAPRGPMAPAADAPFPDDDLLELIRTETRAMRGEIAATPRPPTASISGATRVSLDRVPAVPPQFETASRRWTACAGCGTALESAGQGPRCWSCGRALCTRCYWRLGTGPGDHRCPECISQRRARRNVTTVSGGEAGLPPTAGAGLATPPR